MDNVIVYSAPNCYKCEQLKNKLKQKGIKFNEVNVKDDEVALSKIHSAGFRELPIVEENGEMTNDYITWLLGK